MKTKEQIEATIAGFEKDMEDEKNTNGYTSTYYQLMSKVNTLIWVIE